MFGHDNRELAAVFAGGAVGVLYGVRMLADASSGLSALRWPEATSHKHQRGRLAVISGGLANTGAARLAAQSGLRTGAGLVTLLCPPGALMVVAASVKAVMTASFASAEDLVAQTEKSSAIVIGPPPASRTPPARMSKRLRGQGAASSSTPTR